MQPQNINLKETVYTTMLKSGIVIMSRFAWFHIRINRDHVLTIYVYEFFKTIPMQAFEIIFLTMKIIHEVAYL